MCSHKLIAHFTSPHDDWDSVISVNTTHFDTVCVLLQRISGGRTGLQQSCEHKFTRLITYKQGVKTKKSVTPPNKTNRGRLIKQVFKANSVFYNNGMWVVGICSCFLDTLNFSFNVWKHDLFNIQLFKYTCIKEWKYCTRKKLDISLNKKFSLTGLC